MPKRNLGETINTHTYKSTPDKSLLCTERDGGRDEPEQRCTPPGVFPAMDGKGGRAEIDRGRTPLWTRRFRGRSRTITTRHPDALHPLSITHISRSDLDGGQAGQPAPDDDVAGRRIAGSGQIAAKLRELGQIVR